MACPQCGCDSYDRDNGISCQCAKCRSWARYFDWDACPSETEIAARCQEVRSNRDRHMREGGNYRGMYQTNKGSASAI